MSLPRYPEYKPSGEEWLGDVPAHWVVKPLKYLISLRSGGTPSKENLAFWDGDVPWASSKDLKAEELYDTQDHLSQRAIDEGAAAMVEAGSILAVVRGMILQHTFPVVVARVPMAINQDLKAITPRDEVDSEYLAWLFRGESKQILNRTDEAGHGTKVLRIDRWLSMMVAIPSRAEQRQIDNFLARETAKIDALVAEQRRLMELLKEKRQAVISHAVTRGLNPLAPLKPSGIEWLDDIPKHWEIKRLSLVANFSSGMAHEPYVDDMGQFICVNARFISTAGEARKYCTQNLSPAKKNDVLMVMSDLPNGRALAKAYFVADAAEYAVNQRVAIISPEGAHPRYLFHYLDRNPGFLMHDDGMNQTHLWNDLFKKFPTLVPPAPEQKQIADFVDSETAKFDALTAEAQRAIDLLQERRTALISAAVTGQIDVRGLTTGSSNVGLQQKPETLGSAV